MKKLLTKLCAIVFTCLILSVGCRVVAVHGYTHTSSRHYHSAGCGHYYWHGCWHSHPHPHNCYYHSQFELHFRSNF